VGIVSVNIDSSQFPDAVQSDLFESLRSRQINHKFHYDSIKQTQKWLELHAAYAPSRTDPNCEEVYGHAFEAASRQVVSNAVHLIGLGCGGGQKDTRLLKRLKEQGKQPVYTPCDVSVAMVLVADGVARRVVDESYPLVCDLMTASDFPQLFALPSAFGHQRLITFFGMIPNFEPRLILPRLAGLVGKEDKLLFSANLAPGPDYDAGVQRVLHLYDNALTREWLMIFLLDLGVEKADGELRFSIETDADGLRRITATFHFARAREIFVQGQKFAFEEGTAVRLFYSYRHTPATVTNLLQQYGLKVLDRWVTNSEEEGVFLCASS
jgi:L-histidine N-alpha-methyltransferase